MNHISIQPIRSSDHQWIVELLTKEWGDPLLVCRGQVYHADTLPGFIAYRGEERVGLITYSIKNTECEIVSLNSFIEGQGIGTKLIKAVIEEAQKQTLEKVVLITTNDNTDALRFYQKRGFRIKAVYPNALDLSRKFKPSIPEIGYHGIPLRDEIELEYSI